MLVLTVVFMTGLLGMAFAAYHEHSLRNAPPSSDEVRPISLQIQAGAKTFLLREYRVLVLFALFLMALLFFQFGSPFHPGALLLGALCSTAAGYLGMHVAVESNGRVADACRRSSIEGLQLAFRSGSVMGFSVVSLALLGLSGCLLILWSYFGLPTLSSLSIVNSFALGCSAVALFSRVGGGIYTKSADVGADLVGKVERGIPEDDPRNPAVIADNVGDNVGDVAGMGADLFESLVGTLVASLTIGAFCFTSLPSLLFPLALAAAGLLASILAGRLVLLGVGGLNRCFLYGILTASFLVAIAAWGLTKTLLPETFTLLGVGYASTGVFTAVCAGLLGGVAIGLATVYYTSAAFSPTQLIVHSARTGAGTTVITGLSVGFLSTLLPVLLICSVVYVAYISAGVYGLAIAGVGLLSTLGISLAVDAYGPVADNAAGIAQMAGLPKEVRARADELDSIGNTTAAIGKGFAISSALLSALALFSAFLIAAKLEPVTLNRPTVIIGLLLGTLLPYIFSALIMRGVGRAAAFIIEEARRQFAAGTTDSDRCIAIASDAAITQMLLPGAIAVVAPLVVGYLLGSAVLAGMLAGALVSGFVMAVMMANAGAAWDNAKKFIEANSLEGHSAAVIGDTVGDPLKDSAGPSLNILIKVLNLVSLVFASSFPS